MDDVVGKGAWVVVTMFERSSGWTAVRWTEFVVLGLSVVLAIIEAIQGEPAFELSPKVLAALAIASKSLRVILRAFGQQSSSVGLLSWSIAAFLAVLAIIVSDIWGRTS